jgi:hypothetical protein
LLISHKAADDDKLPLPSPAIPGLLAFRCPSHIARFVIAIVVDAIKRQISWTPTHIVEKQFKAVSPFLAYGNSSATVIMKVRISWICASLNHGAPNMIFRSWCIVPAVTMLPETDCHSLCPETTAALASSRTQADGIYQLFIATIASAQNLGRRL